MTITKCPKCRSNKIIKGGFFINKQRYRCKKCGLSFIERTKDYRKKIKGGIRKKILDMYHTKKDYINKFDNKHRRTYTTREIAFKLGISKTFVHNVIKGNTNNVIRKV